MPGNTKRALLLCILLSALTVVAEDAPRSPATAEERSANSAAPPGKDYQLRLRSIEALRAALTRVAEEKGKTSELTPLQQSIDSDLIRAARYSAAGDYTSGQLLLDDAYSRVVNAIRSLREGDTLIEDHHPQDDYLTSKPTTSKAQLDYDNRAASVEALLAAYRRIAEEQHDTHSAAVQSDVAARQAQARSEVSRGDYAAALGFMNEAYALVQQQLVQLRDGQTLVRSLEFASPAEEYQYYVTKTDSQLEAIAMLGNQLTGTPRQAKVERILAESGVLIEQAKGLAAQQAWSEAIPLMERALNQLMNALMISAAESQ